MDEILSRFPNLYNATSIYDVGVRVKNQKTGDSRFLTWTPGCPVEQVEEFVENACIQIGGLP